jgi:hypothetical protein
VPAAQRRDDEQGRLFFGYFLLAKQKQSDLPPGNPRLGGESMHKNQDRIEQLSQTTTNHHGRL